MNIKVVGIDLAKSIFQVCVWQQDGSIAWNRKVARSKLLHTIRQFPAARIGFFFRQRLVVSLPLYLRIGTQ